MQNVYMNSFVFVNFLRPWLVGDENENVNAPFARVHVFVHRLCDKTVTCFVFSKMKISEANTKTQLGPKTRRHISLTSFGSYSRFRFRCR